MLIDRARPEASTEFVVSWCGTSETAAAKAEQRHLVAVPGGRRAVVTDGPLIRTRVLEFLRAHPEGAAVPTLAAHAECLVPVAWNALKGLERAGLAARSHYQRRSKDRDEVTAAPVLWRAV